MKRWPLVPLRAVTTEAQTGPFGSQLHSYEYVNNGIPVINPSNIAGGRIFPDSKITVDQEKAFTLNRHRLMEGDLVFARRGELGRAAVATKEAAGWICGTGSLRVRVQPGALNSRFANYVLQSAPTRGHFEMQAVGSTMENLNTAIVLSLPIPYPPIKEQQRIADFLDAKVNKIDDFIDKNLKLLSLLEERIDSQILEHVGASQLVNLDSGNTAPPIRKMLSKVVRPPAANGEMITAFRDGQVTARSLRRAEGYTLSSATDAQGQRVEVDDVVIHGLDGFAGAIGTSEAAGNCSPVYHVCTPVDGGNPLFPATSCPHR